MSSNNVLLDRGIGNRADVKGKWVRAGHTKTSGAFGDRNWTQTCNISYFIF